MYLIAKQSYPDAADLLANATQPYTPQTLAARATLLLYCGRAVDAQAAFDSLARYTPNDRTFTEYGLGLCALMQRHLGIAQSHLLMAAKSPEYFEHKPEIDSALSLLDVASGDSNSAVSLASQCDSPAAQEIVALQRIKKSPIDPDVVRAAEALLTSWQLPGGVPRVIEEPGLRAIGAWGGDIDGIVEPAIQSSVGVMSVTQRLLNPVGITHDAPLQKASGQIRLAPRSLRDVPSGSIVSYYIDSDVAATTNSGSYSFQWDTSSVANGPHQITIVISAPAGNVASQSLQYDVENIGADSPSVPALSALDQEAINDAWTLLQLQPSYKLFEMQLSRSEAQLGDRDLALIHQTTAAALDFNYAGGESAIAGDYTGRIPTVFPLSGNRQIAAKKPGPIPNHTMGIWRGNSSIKEVALTFDDGPSPTDTPPLLDALKDSNTPGTFFVVGTRAEVSPDIIRRMHTEGHEVEDHTFTHPNLDEAINEHIYEEILRNAVIVRALTGIWPHFLRPPGGQTNPFVLQAAQKCGMAGAFWTIDVLAAEDIGSPQGVVNFVLSRIRPGAIVLMHNGTYATTQAIPDLASQLRARGYKLVTLLQLAHDAVENPSPIPPVGTKQARAVLER